MKGYKSEKFSVLCQYNSYPKFDVSILQDDRKKVRKTKFLQRTITQLKVGQTRKKLKLDLYYVKTNPYMKFQVNMSKDDKEKYGKLNFSKG